MSRQSGFAHIFFVIIVTSLFLFGTAIGYATYYYHSPGPTSEETTIIFKRGMGFREIVDKMADHSIIRHPLMFKAIAVVLGDARQFKAGEYKFSAAISPRLIMDMIAEGRVVVHKIAIPEGLTVKEILTLLNNEPALEGDIVGEIKEGSLLPDTFHFVYGDSRRDLVNRMQQGMKAAMKELWPKRKENLPVKTEEQAITLASIVEKETGVPGERGRVAAVFVNRLNKGMKLQSDPTVIYAIAQGPLGRMLTSADLGVDSPYNTYKYEGLPPGPIANPSRAALEAVLNPPETNELYFVATGNGGHHFSETLDTHNKNVREYRKVLKKQKTKN